MFSFSESQQKNVLNVSFNLCKRIFFEQLLKCNTKCQCQRIRACVCVPAVYLSFFPTISVPFLSITKKEQSDISNLFQLSVASSFSCRISYNFSLFFSFLSFFLRTKQSRQLAGINTTPIIQSKEKKTSEGILFLFIQRYSVDRK